MQATVEDLARRESDMYALRGHCYRALIAGQPAPPGIGDFGDIVAVPPVRQARDDGQLRATTMFTELGPDGPRWPDGTGWTCDTIIWATGFRPALAHLAPLRLRRDSGYVVTDGTRYRYDRHLHLLGYGDWTGPASATLIGVGPAARDMAAQIRETLAGRP